MERKTRLLESQSDSLSAIEILCISQSRIQMQPRGWIWNHLKSENLRMKDFLSAGQRSCLKSAHRMERDRKIGNRMKVVLLADQGESFAEIAKFFVH